MTEETQHTQEVPENVAKELENQHENVENNVKKRGRPAGSKDKAPRKKKVVVVEEDVSEPQTLLEPPAETSTHIDVKPPKTAKASKAIHSRKEKPQPEPPALPQSEPEPLSPGIVMREASQHILKLKSISAQARRDHIYQTYTAKLHAI